LYTQADGIARDANCGLLRTPAVQMVFSIDMSTQSKDQKRATTWHPKSTCAARDGDAGDAAMSAVSADGQSDEDAKGDGDAEGDGDDDMVPKKVKKVKKVDYCCGVAKSGCSTQCDTVSSQ
jgi:hypothetical protein